MAVRAGLLFAGLAGAIVAASSLMSQTRVPDMPAMPSFDPMASYPCCNMDSNQIVGSMTIAECARKPRHVPKLPGASGTDQFCPAPEQGGGSGGGGKDQVFLPPAPVREFEDEPVWNEYRDNVPNGSFEQWRGTRPVGFGSYRRDENLRNVPPELQDYETVFRSSEAYEGSTAIEIKNFFLDVRDRLAGRPIPAQVMELLGNLALPGGTLTCKEDCPLSTPEGGSAEAFRIPVEKGGGPAVCGIYKDYLAGGDMLFASVALFDGGRQPVAGATAIDIRSTRRSQEEGGWIKFRIPIDRVPGAGAAQPTEATIQFQIVPGGFGGTNAAMVNAGSRAVIDAVHFCGGADLQIADAESSGGEEVPENYEELGAMAWVNWDNDDQDGIFDNDDSELGGKEDDLARLVMKLPEGASGEAILKELGGGGKARLWTTKDKQAGTLWPNTNQPLDIAAEFEQRGGELVKELWAEGLEPSGATGDISWEFEYRPGDGSPPQSDKVALTVLGIAELGWHGNDNSRNDDELLDPDPNHPIVQDRAGGPIADPNQDAPVRVFPGKRYVNNAATGEPRNEVELEIRLTAAPPRPTFLYLRSFDVDDPSANDDEVDDESKSYDNRGGFGGADGTFATSGSSRLELQVNRTVQRTGFHVSMQPGDNYRVAAFGDRDFVEQLDNDDTKLGSAWEDGARIVDSHVLASGAAPADAEIRQPGHFASDTLTVWRFLHVELDSMAEVTKNNLRGTIRRVVRADPYVTSGGASRDAWHLMTDLDIVSQKWPGARGTEGIRNSFFNGQIRVGGTNYFVLGNSANGSPSDSVTIVHDLTEPQRAALENQSFELVDDDYRAITIKGRAGTAGPFEDNAPVPLPPDDRLRESDDNPYLKAYVLPRLDTIRTGEATREFVGNIRIDDAEHIRSYFDQFDQRANEADPALWTVYLLGAFQGTHWEDGDGQLGIGGAYEGAIAGETDGLNGIGGLIYWASGAELEQGNSGADGWRLIDATVHEIGHIFGLEHADGHLMSDGNYGPPSAFFSPKSLAKIRNIPHP